MKKIRKILGEVLALLFLAVLVGGILYIELRGHFVQVSAELPKPPLAVVLALVFPTTLLTLWIAPPLRGRAKKVRDKQEVGIFQALLFVPLGAIGIAVAIAFAPSGYLFLWGYLTGKEVSGIDARVSPFLHLENSGRGCRQKLSLFMDGKFENVCVDERIVGPLPRPGQTVKIRGIVSPVGIWVKEVRVDQ